MVFGMVKKMCPFIKVQLHPKGRRRFPKGDRKALGNMRNLISCRKAESLHIFLCASSRGLKRVEDPRPLDSFGHPTTRVNCCLCFLLIPRGLTVAPLTPSESTYKQGLGYCQKKYLSFHKSSTSSEGAAKVPQGRPQSPWEYAEPYFLQESRILASCLKATFRKSLDELLPNLLPR